MTRDWATIIPGNYSRTPLVPYFKYLLTFPTPPFLLSRSNSKHNYLQVRNFISSKIFELNSHIRHVNFCSHFKYEYMCTYICNVKSGPFQSQTVIATYSKIKLFCKYVFFINDVVRSLLFTAEWKPFQSSFILSSLHPMYSSLFLCKSVQFLISFPSYYIHTYVYIVYIYISGCGPFYS